MTTIVESQPLRDDGVDSTTRDGRTPSRDTARRSGHGGAWPCPLARLVESVDDETARLWSAGDPDHRERIRAQLARPDLPF
jgi:hypothetical protein